MNDIIDTNINAGWMKMSQHHLHSDIFAPAIRARGPYTHYLVVLQENGWFIKFNGEDDGHTRLNARH